MSRIIRINLAEQRIYSEEITENHPFYNFAGRALSSKIISEEVPPDTDPLSAQNKLIIAAGFLTGTPCPNSGRISIGGKSPLTNGVKESNVGGKAPALIGRHDIRGLVFEQKAKEWNLLIIHPDGDISLESAEHLKGLNNYALAEKLREKYGGKIGILSIGAAGEKLLKGASIASTDLEGFPSRHAGRGGLGAVMGSKKLKAVVVFPPEKTQITYHDLPAFKKESREWGLSIYKAKRMLSQFGTLVGLPIMNSLNGLPTQNFRRGSYEKAEQISGESLFNYIQANNGKSGIACSPGCVIKCSNLVKNAEGKHLTSSLEYETVALNGSNLLIGNLEDLAKIDHACDDVGLDTIEFGNAAGVYMEAGKIPWGDAQKVVELIYGIMEDHPDSLAVANGAVHTGKKYKVERVANVKGQGFPGYDPRAFKGMGVTYLTSPMGADHTAGSAISGRFPNPDKNYGKVTDPEHKVELSKGLQIFTMIHDSIGQCFFVNPTYQSTPHIVALLNARYCWNLTPEELIIWSKAWLKMERDYNRRVGLKEVDEFPSFVEKYALEDNPQRKWDVPQEELLHFWDDFE